MEHAFNPNSVLPNELWLKIFTSLPGSDLKNVKLVCKHWRNLIQTSNLNNKFTLWITRYNWENIRQTLENDRIFSRSINYRNLYINSVNFTQTDLRILRYIRRNVQNVVIRCCSITPKWCGPTVFKNLKTLDIDYTSLKHEQCLKFASPVLTELRIEILGEASAIYGFELIKRVSCTISKLDMTNYRTDMPVLKSLKNSFRSITNLKALKINGYSFHNGLKVILETLPKTNHLKYISLHVPVTNDILKIILEKWSNTLQEIYLSDSARINDEAYKYFNLVKNNLVHLELTACKGITRESLLEGLISTSNTVLRTLILNCTPNIDEDILCTLCQHLPNLTDLSLIYCDEAVTNKSLAYMSDYLIHLEKLYLDLFINFSLTVADMSISMLRRSTLRVLHVANRKITKRDLEQLVRNCPGLQDLNICCCPDINDDAIFIIVNNLKQLHTLDISCCREITGRSIDYIIMYGEQLKELLLYGKWSADTFNLNAVKEKLLTFRPDMRVYFNS